MEVGQPRLAPLVLATMASQALLVVLSPTIVEIGDDLEASVATVGQARSVTAGTAIVASLVIAGRIDSIGLPRLLGGGAALAIVGCAAVAAAPTIGVFLAAHVVAGLAFAALLSAGFTGVAAFAPERRAWAVGYVAGANALAWITVNPIVGLITDWASWRWAQAVPAAVAAAALLAAPAAVLPSTAPAAGQLRSLLSRPSARRWLGSELIAYGAWTSLLTFVGAFFIERLDVGEGTVGWLLASGAATYFIASTRSGALAQRLPRRHLVAGSALLMGALMIPQLALVESTALSVAMFSLVGIVAGVRTPASSALGLEQLPDHPGAMMAARTAVTQLGYLLGAVMGGAVIAGAGYGMLGLVLAAGMTVSAALILRVDDPLEAGDGEGGTKCEPSSPP